MSDEQTGPTRRSVVKKMGAVSAAGLATGTSTVSATSGLRTRRAVEGHDLTASPSTILDRETLRDTPSDIDVPESVATGTGLLSRLAADGLLESASIDDLPTGELSESKEGVYRVVNDGVVNVGFRQQVQGGTVDIVFGEDTVPIAKFHPEDGRTPVLYGSRDGRTIERIDPDQTGRELSNNTSSFYCEDSLDCDPCECTLLLCGYSYKSIVCGGCYKNECVTTSKCTCAV